MSMGRCFLWMTCGALLPCVAVADEFLLKDGRLLRGTVQKVVGGDAQEKQYVVELSPGITVLIDGQDIKTPKSSTPKELEYAKLMTQSEPKDTVAFHLAVAGWCKQNGLIVHETAHYERVIQLDPENEVARAGLKYTKGKDGRWIKINQLQTENRGKVLSGGRYRFPELVALEEAQEQAKEERIKLVGDITRWQRDLIQNNQRAADAETKLRGLTGPYASSALSELLLPKTNTPMRKDPLPDGLRQLYVEVLTRLGDGVAIQTLIRLSLHDPSPAIRDFCLDGINRLAPRAAAMAYIAALRSNEIDEINAAGRALSVIRDESAILPLIERVVSTHKRKIQGSSATDTRFDSSGGFTFGGAPTRTVEQKSNNVDVLGALVAITKVNFQYDRGAWLNWYHHNYFPSVSDLRRDP